MNNDLFLKDLLFVYNNITALLRNKEKMVFKAYNGNKLICDEVEYNTFIDECVKINNYDEESKGKLTRFITNLNVNEGYFEQTANFKTKDGKPLPTVVRGKKIDDEKVLIVIADFEDKRDEIIDPITKVYNHFSMVEEIKAEILKNKEFILMIVDIDNFTAFTNQYGSMFGDVLLLETASSIRKYIEKKGYIGRLYDDQFAIVVHIDNDYDVVHNACTSIRAAIANLSNHNVKQAKITATIGCACYPNDAITYDELMLKAQKALLRGKRKGKNCFIIYTEKCKDIRDDEVEIPQALVDKKSSSPSANLIASIYDILTRGGDQKNNVNEAISLVGNYFMLDRVVLIARAPERERFQRASNTYEWISPLRGDLRGLVEANEDRAFYWEEVWEKSFDNTGMIKIAQIESNKDNLDLYTQLSEQKTSAMVAIQLMAKDKICGIIRYDMCSTNRFWTQKDISDLIVVSKLFAIDMQRYRDSKETEQALFYDSLTKLYNYSKWRSEVYNKINSQEIYNKYSLLYMSISGFNTLNNLYGMSYGNVLLKAIAEGLMKYNLDDSIFCHITEDKFLIYYDHSNLDVIKEKFKLLKEFAVTQVNLKKVFKIHAGLYIHNEIDNLTTAIDKANIARKQSSIPEDGLVIFDEEMYLEDQKRNQIELYMYDALKNEEFKLYLQPKVNTETGEVIGAEALTRWHYKNKLLLSPDRFIPIFEKNGFINTLDYKVFRNVCEFQKKCIDNGIKPKKISVNVSRYQRDFNKYIEEIDSIRNEYNIPASIIEIEITEGMYIENIDQISEFIMNLHKSGYSVSMDDFGSGYSNLSNLANLNFDLIKLDKNFCNDKDNEKENIILSYVMSLVKQLKMDVLCEGVETEDFAKYLQSLGCNLVQGFLFEKPIPADEFYEKYLANDKKFNVKQ